MRKRILIGFTGLLVACSGGSPTQGQGELRASDAAHAYGVDAYRLSGDVVEVYGLDDRLAVIAVEAPSTDSRLVRIGQQPSGQEAEYEITRPLPDGHFQAPVDVDRDGVVLADPVLRDFFARHQLAFESTDLTALARQGGTLNPSATTSFPACGDIPFAANCYPGDCYGAAGAGTIHHTIFSGWGSTQGECESACGAYYGIVAGSQCQCYSSYTSTLDRYASCQYQNCSSGYFDKVSKRRTCLSPGSCTNAAQGWTGQCEVAFSSNTSCSANWQCSSNSCVSGKCTLNIGDVCHTSSYYPPVGCPSGVSCLSPNNTCKAWETCYCGGMPPF